LAQAALETMILRQHFLWEGFRAGITLELYPDSLPLQHQVELVQTWSKNQAELLALLERNWAAKWQNEETIKKVLDFDARQIRLFYLWDCQADRLQAELWLARARLNQGKPLPLAGHFQNPGEIIGHPLESKDMAQAKYKAALTDPQDLARAWQEISQRKLDFAWKNFQPAFVIQAGEISQFIEAELEVSDNPLNHLETLNRHLVLMVELEGNYLEHWKMIMAQKKWHPCPMPN
jgi:hypothetical protein